jgi:hypothetical protein
MKYTVVWDPDAEQELASLWMAAAERQALTDAADQIDKVLRQDPQQQGESRPDGLRILFVEPLGIIFRVHEDDRLVRVLQVWSFG